jgi:hypothetical protein
MLKRFLVFVFIGFFQTNLLANDNNVIPPKEAQATIQKHLTLIQQKIEHMQGRFQSEGAKKTLKIQIDSANINDQAGAETHLGSMSDSITLEWLSIYDDFYSSHQKAINNSLRVAEKKQIVKSDLTYLAKGMERWLVIEGQLNALMNYYAKILGQRGVSLGSKYEARTEKRAIQSKFLEMASKANRFFDEEEMQALKPVNAQLEKDEQRVVFLESMLNYLSDKMRNDLAQRQIFSGLDVEPRLPIEEPKDTYKITSLEISDYEWWGQKTKYDESLNKLDEQIQQKAEALENLEPDFSKNDIKLKQLSQQISETKDKIKPILEKVTILLEQKAPEPYRSDYVKYKFYQELANRIQRDIINLKGKAKRQKAAGQTRDARASLDLVAKNFIELGKAEQQADTTKLALKPYFDELDKQTEQQKTLSIELTDTFNRLKRSQQTTLDERQRLHNKQNKITQEINQIHQQRNIKLDEKVAFLKKGEPKITSIYVQANGKTVYAANAETNPKDELQAMQDLVSKAKENLDQTNELYQRYKVRFETDFDETREALSRLGGATGAIMQTAYLQVGAESLFYFIDIAEQWAEGGPIAALTDAIGKGVVAWTSEQPAFQSADEKKVLASLFGHSTYSGARSEYFSLSMLESTGIERLRTEAYMYGVRDKALNENAVKLIDAARSNDDSFSNTSKAFGRFLDDKGQVRKSLEKGKNYLEHLRNSKDTLKGVMGEYAKDLVKNYLKESAKSIEESAWADYFIQDMIARKSFQLFQKMREEYWQTLDIYRDLVSARNEIVKLKNNYDVLNEMLVTQNEEIEQNSYIKVNVDGSNDEIEETVKLGSVTLLKLKLHQYYWQTGKLNAEGKGDISLSIVQRAVENKIPP